MIGGGPAQEVLRVDRAREMVVQVAALRHRREGRPAAAAGPCGSRRSGARSPLRRTAPPAAPVPRDGPRRGRRPPRGAPRQAIARVVAHRHRVTGPACPARRHVEGDERRLAAVRARGEHHAVRLDAHQLRGLQVEHDDDRPADERLGLVGLRDAGDNRALLGADVDLHLHELVRLRHALGGQHRATRSSTFMKSSIEMRSAGAGGAGCCSAGCHGARCWRCWVRRHPVRAVRASSRSSSPSVRVWARGAASWTSMRSPSVRQRPSRSSRRSFDGDADAAQDLRARRRHHRREQHGREPDGLGRVEEDLRQAIGRRGVLRQLPRRGLGDVLVGRVDRR